MLEESTPLTTFTEKIAAAAWNPKKIEFARRTCVRFGAFQDLRVANKCHKQIPYFGDLTELKDEQNNVTGYYFAVAFADYAQGMSVKGIYFDRNGLIEGYHFKSGLDECALHVREIKRLEDFHEKSEDFHKDEQYAQAVRDFHKGKQVQGNPYFDGMDVNIKAVSGQRII